MEKLESIIRYFCENYPNKEELSDARLTKMVYLADWRSAITDGEQLTKINWKFDHYGPYVPDIIDQAGKSDALEVERTSNIYGNKKKKILLKEGKSRGLGDSDREKLDHVIEKTKDLTWNKFIELVYSTYPVMSEDKYNDLDLVSLASDYKDSMKSQETT